MTRHPLFRPALVAAAVLLAPALPSGVAAAAEPTAAELSEQAYERYQASDYPSAVALYMKAYNLSVDSRILFNVAQIYDKKVQDRELALEYYRRYLKATTTEPDLVKKSTERVTELQRQQEELAQKAAPTATPTATPAATAPATASPTATPPATAAPSAPPADSRPVWIGYGLAGLLGAGAVVTGALALTASGDVSKGTYSGAAVPADLDSAASRAGVLGITTDVLIGSAVVTAAITLVVHLAGAKPAAEKKASLLPEPSGRGAAWRF